MQKEQDEGLLQTGGQTHPLPFPGASLLQSQLEQHLLGGAISDPL